MKSKILLMTRVSWLLAILLLVGHNSMKAQTYVAIGTGSLTNTTISYPAPYGNFFYGARHQFLILASELSAANVAPSSVISQIGFNVQTPAGQPLQSFSIKMASTAATSLTTTFIEAGLTAMFDPIQYTTVPGWNTHTFTNGGYVWDGTSNILVDVCFNNTSWTTNAISYYSTTASVRASYRYADAQGNCIDPGYQSSTARPNMRLTVGGVNIPPPIAPLANYQFVLGVDTLWERSPSILTNTSTYQDRSYWDITGYNDDSTNGLWDPFYTVRQPNAWGTWIDTVGNKTNFNYKFPLPGYYKVKLLCVNLFGVSQIEKVVFVARPTIKPSAYFFANKSKTGVGDQIQMYDASANGPIGWSWWLTPPCIACGQFINEFFPSNDLPRPVLNANEGGTYTVCMAVWNDIGGDTVCRSNYIKIIDGFTICNGSDSVTKSVEGYLYPPFFQTYTSLYYAAQSCPASSAGFRIAPCADTLLINLERLKLRTQDSLQIRTGSFNGPVLRRWGGNNLAGLPDSSKNFKYKGQELFVRFLPGTPNTPSPYYVNDSGFALKWLATPATFGSPTASFTCLDTVYSGYKMTLNNTTAGTNLDFGWDLNGDGFYGMDNPLYPDSVSPSPTYTFFSFVPITKRVCLRARNCKGSNTACRNVVVLPLARAPLADFMVDKTSGFTTDTFRFTDMSQFGASTWKWTINPSSVTYILGTTSASQNPIVKFGSATTYDITLEATNPFGTTSITKQGYVSTLNYPNPGSVYPPQANDMDVGITRVVMLGTAGKIDTTTALKDAAYSSYYLSSQAVVYRGATYIVDVYRTSVNDAEKARIWIDFNRNTNYTDPGETIYSRDSLKVIKISQQFTVPNNANTGLTRMLIGVSPDYSNISPSLATLGVYEDHGLIVGQDLVKPVVTLLGKAIHHTEVNKAFVDPFVTALDNIEGDITSRVVTVGTVDNTKLGYYNLKYYVIDNYGNVSDTVYRTVQVEVSTIPPTLTLFPPDSLTMQVYYKFPEPGYVAKDNNNTNVTQYVVVGGNLDTATLGKYTVTYSISDAFGNNARKSRTVIVRDTMRPVISCRLGANVTTVIHELKTPFEDNDYIKVVDNYYKNVGFSRSGVLNINKRGIYPLIYDAVDGSGNVAFTFTLYVQVKSTQSPTIKLIGEPEVLVNVLSPYTELGATAKDFENNPLGVIIGSQPNTDRVGDYDIIYTATDIDGNSATAKRTVKVRDTEAPKITLLGQDPFYVLMGDPTPFDQLDPGIKVSDNYYEPSHLIVKKNYKSIHTEKEGQYYATYDASDSSGNVAAQMNRLVIVVLTKVGLQEAIQTNGYAIYPNPASTNLNIDLAQGEIKKIEIFDIQGKLTDVVPQSVTSNNCILNLTNQNSGLYLIRIETKEGRIINSKFTIVK